MASLFDDSLRKIKFLFKFSGMQLEKKSSATILHIIRYRWLYIFNFLWLNTDVIGEVFWIIDGAANGKKLNELTYIAPCTTLCMLANLKSIFLLLNEDELTQLIKNLREMAKNEIGNENTEKDKIIKEQRSFLNFVISALNFWNAMTVIAFSLTPLVLMDVEFRKTNEIELMLPFLIVYPIDPYDIKYWPFVYLHQVWSACIVVLEMGGADCLFYTCCAVIQTQFRLLQHDFEGVISGHASEFQEKFEKLVIRHQELMRSVNLLETIYTKSTLFNFVSSSFLICLTGFNVTAIDDVAFVLSFLTFLLMSLLQIFLLCFFGDMIMTSSMDVSHAIYNSKWYTAKASTAKQLFLVQIRAQKPCKLTASSYADVNLRAFMRILSTAWSYFALLKTIEKD
uniref:Odorant receptor n=1 Tax=Ctenopseustis herana TaxID=65029 RepID=A0A097ITS7_9NEOP|nr:olfactory receptor 11 [Ctenopseustis herana]